MTWGCLDGCIRPDAPHVGPCTVPDPPPGAWREPFDDGGECPQCRAIVGHARGCTERA